MAGPRSTAGAHGRSPRRNTDTSESRARSRHCTAGRRAGCSFGGWFLHDDHLQACLSVRCCGQVRKSQPRQDINHPDSDTHGVSRWPPDARQQHRSPTAPATRGRPLSEPSGRSASPPATAVSSAGATRGATATFVASMSSRSVTASALSIRTAQAAITRFGMAGARAGSLRCLRRYGRSSLAGRGLTRRYCRTQRPPRIACRVRRYTESYSIRAAPSRRRW